MPILGYNIAGAASWGSKTWKIGSHDITDAQGGNITFFHVAIAVEVGTGLKLAVYDSKQDGVDKGNPANCSLIEQVVIEEMEVSDDFSVVAPEGNLLAADTRYWLGYIVKWTEIKIKFDVAQQYDAFSKSGTTYNGEFIDPWQATAAQAARLVSVWVDYEVFGEEFIRSISDTIGISDILLKSVIFTRSMTDIINISDILTIVKVKFGKIIVGITDIPEIIITQVKNIDCSGVCKIVGVKVKEKLVSVMRKIYFFQHPE